MEKITITRNSLIRALREWDYEAQVNNWPHRVDDKRHEDNADYLLAKLTA